MKHIHASGYKLKLCLRGFLLTCALICLFSLSVRAETAWIAVTETPVVDDFSTIAAGKDGNIWLCSYSSGLYCYNGSTWTEYSLDFDSQKVKMSDFALSGDGSVYTVTDIGMCRLSDGEWETIIYPYSFVDPYFSEQAKITIDGTGAVWCSLGPFLMSYSDNDWTVHGSWNGYTDYACNTVALAASSDGRVAISVYICDDETNPPYGTYLYCDGLWSKTDTSTLLSWPFVSTLSFNAGNELWASDGSKLYQLAGNAWEYKYRGNSLGHKDICFDTKTNIWASGEFGIYRFDGGVWEEYTREDGLPGAPVLSIAEDNDRVIWALTPKGLARYTAGTISVDHALPEIFNLKYSYPNPANPCTTIEYSLDEAADIELTVHNALGQAVRTLAEVYMDAGEHRILWDGRDEQGIAVSTGLYIVNLRAGGRAASMKMTVIK